MDNDPVEMNENRTKQIRTPLQLESLIKAREAKKAKSLNKNNVLLLKAGLGVGVGAALVGLGVIIGSRISSVDEEEHKEIVLEVLKEVLERRKAKESLPVEPVKLPIEPVKTPVESVKIPSESIENA